MSVSGPQYLGLAVFLTSFVFVCLFIANLPFLSCKYLMGNKRRSEKEMQTLTLSCNIQQTSEGEEARLRGLTATQMSAWVGFVSGSFGGAPGVASETSCQKPSLCPIRLRSASSKTPQRLILEQFVKDCSSWEGLTLEKFVEKAVSLSRAMQSTVPAQERADDAELYFHLS